MIQNEINCLNCETIFEGNFCPNCGQKANTKRFNLKAILSQLPAQIFQFEKGLLLTFRDLITRPGKLIKEYIAGKRVTYTHPINYWLMCTAIAALITIQFLDPLMGKLGVYSVTDTGNFMKKFMGWIFSHYSLFIGLSVPFYALGTYVCFKKSNFNYAEHLVINLYLLSQQTLLSTFILPLEIYLPTKLIICISTAPYIYNLWVYWQVFETKFWWKAILLGMVSILLSLVVLEIAIMVIGAIAAAIYGGIYGVSDLKNIIESIKK